MITLSLRKALAADLDQVTAIEALTLASWNRDFFLQELGLKDSAFIVAETEERIIGFAVARHIAGEAELFKIAVLTEYRRKGVAVSILKEIIRLIDPRKIFLEVSESNSAARAFYETMGFRKNGERRGYYGNENAVLMEWNNED